MEHVPKAFQKHVLLLLEHGTCSIGTCFWNMEHVCLIAFGTCSRNMFQKRSKNMSYCFWNMEHVSYCFWNMEHVLKAIRQKNTLTQEQGTHRSQPTRAQPNRKCKAKNKTQFEFKCKAKNKT